jgi:hypothetical protein
MYTKSLTRLYNFVDNEALGVPSGMAHSILQSLGMETLTPEAVADVVSYTFGTSSEGTLEHPVKKYSSEVTRRLLDNVVYLYKTKGTHRSLRALLNTYGIPAFLLSV